MVSNMDNNVGSNVEGVFIIDVIIALNAADICPVYIYGDVIGVFSSNTQNTH